MREEKRREDERFGGERIVAKLQCYDDCYYSLFRVVKHKVPSSTP